MSEAKHEYHYALILGMILLAPHMSKTVGIIFGTLFICISMAFYFVGNNQK